MKIRSHLVVLVLAAVLPVFAFSAVMTAVFWRQQRAAFEQRFLERVRAMSNALDRQIEGTIATLQGLANAPEIDTGDLRTFYEHARRVAAVQPTWSTVVLFDPGQKRLFNLRRPFGAPLPGGPSSDPQTFGSVVTTATPGVSRLLKGSVSQAFTTSVLVPVVRNDTVRYVLLAHIDHPEWLRFLSSYPVATGATMLLLDQDRTVIARTLDHERWVGQRMPAAVYERSLRPPEGAYRIVGLEGQRVYGAHSRSRLSGWTVATGVPIADVEAALWGSSLAMGAGATVAIVLAVALAFVFGRRIARPVSALAQTASALAKGAEIARPGRTGITEVAEVGNAFADAARVLGEARRAAERARVAAEEANRAKDHFLAALSHELRTPLTPVLTGISLLERDRTLSERARQYLDVLRRNVVLEARLIDDLLDLTRIVHGKVELDRRHVELGTVIERAIEVCRPDIETRRLHFDVDWGPRPYRIDADATRLQQVLWNLLKNAIKFTPVDGCVGVRCRRSDGEVVVEVADSGIGIEPGTLDTIFDTFAQPDRATARQFGGLGLGLAISKALVELHGGRIAARSEGRGTGATFTVRLPLVTAGAGTAADTGPPPTRRVAAAGGPGLDILLVEDHGDTAQTLVSVLELEGHRVRTAGDVATALLALAQGTFDVLISDLGLPDASGLDLMRQLRASGHRLPGIALSGYGHEADIAASQAAGFQIHLVKPSDPDRLLRAIDAAVQAP